MSEIEKVEQVKQTSMRELTLEEMEAVSGGKATYECTVKVDSKGNKSIECKVSGSF